MAIPFARSPVGDRYVLELLRERGWGLGGESSGHILCLDLTTTGDGIVSALQALVLMVEADKALHELKQGMTKLPQAIVNVAVDGAPTASVCERAAPALRRKEKALGDDYRVLIRPSGTEPVVRVMVEGNDSQDVATIAEELAAVIEKAV